MVSKNYYKLAYYNFVKQSHYYIFINNFKFYISQFFKTFNFLSVFIRFAKNQFAILITRGFNPLRSNAIAHNGLKPHCYKEWIASSNAFAMTIKNNLVNTFLTLTKFNFDSLSRKIKNPCLVINKNFFKGFCMHKLLTILFILLSFTVSCNRDGKEDSNSKGRKFGYTCMRMDNPFFLTIEEAIKEELAKNGDTLIALDPQQDQAKQISQVEDMIVQGIELIFLNPVDWQGVQPALQALKNAGIPIVNFDSEVYDIQFVDSLVKSDNYRAGFVCGQDLTNRMPNGGKLAIIEYATTKSVLDRINGFYDGLGDYSNKFNLVSRQDGQGSIQLSLSVAENILQANPDIDVFFGGNDPIALGIVAALKAANKKDILVYGVDGSPELKAEIKNGYATGTGAQSPINIAKKSVEVAYKILNNEDYDKEIYIEMPLIDINNVDEYGVDGWQ